MSNKPPPDEWVGVKFTCKIGAAVAAHLVAKTETYNHCARIRLWYQPCCPKCMHTWKTQEKDRVKSWWAKASEYYNVSDAAAHEAAKENKHVDGTILRPPGMPPMKRAETPFNPRSSTARSSTARSSRVVGNSSTVVDASDSTTECERERRQSKYGDRIKPKETGRMGKERQAEWAKDKHVKGGKPKSAAAAVPKRKRDEHDTQRDNTRKTQRTYDRGKPKPPSRPPRSSSHGDHSSGRGRQPPRIRGSIAEASARSPSERSSPTPPGELRLKMGHGFWIGFKPPKKRPASREDSRSPLKRRRRTSSVPDSRSNSSSSEFDELWDA